MLLLRQRINGFNLHEFFVQFSYTVFFDIVYERKYYGRVLKL